MKWIYSSVILIYHCKYDELKFNITGIYFTSRDLIINYKSGNTNYFRRSLMEYCFIVIAFYVHSADQ